jgi:hypothetical protein
LSDTTASIVLQNKQGGERMSDQEGQALEPQQQQVSQEIAIAPDSQTQDGCIRLGMIPFILYQEVVEVLGNGKKRIRNENSPEHSAFSELRPDDRATGFQGGVWFRRHYEHLIFELFVEIPNFDDLEWEDSVFAPQPVLKIVGGPKRGGIWAARSGDLMVETCSATIGSGGRTGRGYMHLKTPGMKLVLLLLYRASDLANRPNCIHESYWSADRY